MKTKHLLYLSTLLEKEIHEKRLFDCSVHVEHRGKAVFSAEYGQAKKDSIYRIFSMTKPITTVAAMILFERGLIDFYDPLYEYLPAFKNMQTVLTNTKGNETLQKAKKPILLRDLLNMTSGIVYPGEACLADRSMRDVQKSLEKESAKGKNFSNVEVCSRLAESYLQFEPGEGWRYGASADILGGVIEVVAGMTFGTFLKKEIFEPLEMNETSFTLSFEDEKRLLPFYSRSGPNNTLEPSSEAEIYWMNNAANFAQPLFESGGAGLYSTTKDYLHFAKMLLNKGTYKKERIISKKTVSFMAKDNLNEVQKKWVNFDNMHGYGYGNFLRVMTHLPTASSNGSIGEYGWDGLPGTYFFVDPKEELLMVYMQQIKDGADQHLRRKMRQIIYSAL
ncbi:MAG: serine hydrolase [Treponema sp.]|jgi:CubicO group peptidase (beta-lactamase class C family)|nr:serine hydrolase [Treponema sp.]